METEKKEFIKYSNWKLFKDIIFYIKPFRFRFIFASFFRLSGDIVNLYPAIALASIITFLSSYTMGSSLDKVWLLFFLWLLATTWRNISVHFAKYLGFQVSEQSALNAQLNTIKHLFLLDMVWHEKENAGNKLKKIQRGSAGIDRIIRMWFNNYIEIGVNFIGMLIILSREDKFIGVILVVFLITYYIISFFTLRKASALVQTVNAKDDDINGLVFQAINNIRSVKVSGIQVKLNKMISAQVDEMFTWIKKRIYNFQMRGAVLNVWSLIFRIGTLVFIVYGISRGTSDVGYLVLFNAYFLRLLESVNELSQTTQDLIVNKYGIASMQAILNERIRIEDEKDKVDFPKKWKKIKINNLSFSYGKNKVLKNISFEIKRGERIGIVGLSGAGKSTLFKLLLKEDESFDGEIMIDGISIKNIKKNSFLEKVGVVLQDTEVFNFTLRDNITIACERELGEKELMQALDISYVSDFAYQLPKGLDTFIGEKGIKLSGGEKQRLGIARCVYKQPELILLDEATSHLDLESEERIKESLHSFFKKVTAVVIAHRLTTIREMDRILVLEKGKFVEEGSFDDLYRKKGRFYELWKKQKL